MRTKLKIDHLKFFRRQSIMRKHDSLKYIQIQLTDSRSHLPHGNRKAFFAKNLKVVILNFVSDKEQKEPTKKEVYEER
jgi:hypothetical protein